jgi:hypothetical protein
MREDCKYFQRRIHASGDATQFCALDLAPEAPWRCPAGCRRYTPLPGTRGPRAGPADAADTALGTDLPPGAVAILGSAEEIIGAVGPEIAAEQRRHREEEERRNRAWWRRLKGRPSRWRR